MRRSFNFGSLSLIVGICEVMATNPAAAQPTLAPESQLGPVYDSTASQEPLGFLLIEEGVYTDLQQTPLRLMSSAETAFRAKKYHEAEVDLRSAAELTRIAGNGDPSVSKVAVRTAQALDAFAMRVGAGKVKSDSDFLKSLGMAAQGIAEHHRLIAVQEWSARQTRRAGHDLAAAADATTLAARWSGQRMAATSNAIIAEAKSTASKLVQGTGAATAEVGDSIRSLGSEIDRLGKRMETSRAAH